MKIAFSWDDGALEDQKLFELHEKYEIPGMFFVPTRNREGRDVLTPEMLRKAESRFVAFGGHTENHTYLTELSNEKIVSEISLNKQYLEEVLGHEVSHFCLPGGQYTTEILDTAYRYYQTVRTADTMNFYYNGGALKPALHFYPRGIKSLIGNALKNASYSEAMFVAVHGKLDYFQLIEKLIENEERKNESIVMIWGHSWELEKYQLWNKLENLMQSKIIQQNKVEYADMFLIGNER